MIVAFGVVCVLRHVWLCVLRCLSFHQQYNDSWLMLRSLRFYVQPFLSNIRTQRHGQFISCTRSARTCAWAITLARFSKVDVAKT